MQYTRMGNTGLVVSRLAFGAMTFGPGTGAMAIVSKLGEDAARELVAQSLDAGINHFNSADAYSGGESERMLGLALGSRRKDVVISTKVGFRSGQAILHQGLSAQHIIASCERSLQRLGTDYIDVYLLHRFDPLTPVEESVEALDLLVRQGKVRYVGFSNWPAWFAAKGVGVQTQRGFTRFRAAEMYYSLLGRDLEREVAPFAEDAGIGVFVWSPLAGGFLSGKYTRENPQGDGGRLTGFDIIPHDRERSYDLVEEMRKIGASHNASVAQVALAWILTKPWVTSILLGASKSAQLADNLGACDVKLSADALAELDKLSAQGPAYPNWFITRTGKEPVVTKALEG